MKVTALFFVGIALGLRTAGAAGAPPLEFNGVLVADGKTKVALSDPTSGATEWVAAGGEFKGYKIARYDAKTDSVVLIKDGQEYPLHLVAAKSQASVTNTALPATATPILASVPSQSPTPSGTSTAPVAPLPSQSDAPLAPTGLVTPGPSTSAVNPPPAPVPPGAPSAPTSVNVSVTPVVPVPGEVNYLTKEGDTLTKISAATGLSLERLQELNPGVNASALLKAGNPVRTQ